MKERYDSQVAMHYAAYRPPLHALILKRVIGPEELFHRGLDIGCGTGYSAMALVDYCDHVHGLDASRDMLERSESHAQITYVRGNAHDLSCLGAQDFEVVTFAGSLTYTKSDQLRGELSKVMAPNAIIVVYDFEILFEGVMAGLGFDASGVESDYDHSVDLSDWADFTEMAGGKEQLELQLTVSQLAHMLLSDSNRFEVIKQAIWGDSCDDLFDELVNRLEGGSDGLILPVNIYYRKYRRVSPTGL